MPTILLPASAAAFAPRSTCNVVLNTKVEPWLTATLKRINKIKRPLNSVPQHTRCLTETLSSTNAIWSLCSLMVPKAPESELRKDSNPLTRGHKIVVQTLETFASGGVPAFVETLDAVEVAKKAGMSVAPVMIYGDDVSHVVTEEGISYLYKTEGLEERRRAIAAIAGVSPIGIKAKPEETAALRKKGIVTFPEDLGVHRLEADRSLLAARSMEDLVAWSGGLYQPPAKFRSW